MATIPEYKAWWAARDRCHNPDSQSYKWYGARGIQMYEPWQNDWRAFLTYIGYRPSPRHTLERINSDGDYAPGNVKWATWREQKLNSRSGPRRLDLTGQRFGRLTVLHAQPKQPRRMTHWVCRCDCGQVRAVGIGALRDGRSVSCGCFNRDRLIARNKGQHLTHPQGSQPQ